MILINSLIFIHLKPMTMDIMPSYITQIPNMQQSSNVKYRVWLLDNVGNEVFKTLDTDGINHYVDLTNIYDNSLEFGWNWFSLNMLSEDMDINNILSALGSSGIYIKGQQAYSDYYDGVGWLGTLNEFELFPYLKVDFDLT